MIAPGRLAWRVLFVNRRIEIMSKSLLLLCIPLLAVLLPAPAPAAFPDDAKIGGFVLGCQAYTFNRFSVFEAIEKTAEAGGKTIEFYPGQKLSSEEPNVKWDHHASAEVIEKVK